MMANTAVRVVAAFFDEKGLKYSIIGEKEDCIKLGFTMDSRDGLDVLIIMDEDGESAKVRAYDLAKFPANKIDVMYKTCNELNKDYRWLKFFVDESDNTITCDMDAIIQLDSCGMELYELCFRLVHIADEAYPRFMKALYA